MAHKLLLADDSITIQRVIELTFADEDVQVFAVGDGKHAIDRIQADRPDIVLADVGMPERDGYEVAAFIKGDPAAVAHSGASADGRVRAHRRGPRPRRRLRRRARQTFRATNGHQSRQGSARRPSLRCTGTPNSNQPAAQPPADQPAATAAAPPPGAAKQAGDSLEDYFDRLDAAFATLGGDTAPRASRPPRLAACTTPPAAMRRLEPATAEDFASWDPDLAGDAGRPAHHARPCRSPLRLPADSRLRRPCQCTSR